MASEAVLKKSRENPYCTPSDEGEDADAPLHSLKLVMALEIKRNAVKASGVETFVGEDRLAITWLTRRKEAHSKEIQGRT